MQFNFTDEESRIMKAGSGDHVEQAYNAQAVECVDAEVRQVSVVCADTGYFSKAAVKTVEAVGNRPTVYCAIERQGHHRTVEDLERKPEPQSPPESASIKEKMAYRLKTTEGHRNYKKRKETIEPAFGIIKSVLGFRQFLMRGLDKVNIEWDLVTLAYNLKRMHKFTQGQWCTALVTATKKREGITLRTLPVPSQEALFREGTAISGRNNSAIHEIGLMNPENPGIRWFLLA